MTAADIEMHSDPIRGSGARFFVPGVISVSIYSSDGEIAKHLRTIGDDQIKFYWSWRRFLFYADAETLARLRKHLK